MKRISFKLMSTMLAVMMVVSGFASVKAKAFEVEDISWISTFVAVTIFDSEGEYVDMITEQSDFIFSDGTDESYRDARLDAEDTYFDLLARAKTEFVYLSEDPVNVENYSLYAENDALMITHIIYVQVKPTEEGNTPGGSGENNGNEGTTTPSYGIVADEESTTAVNTLSYTEGSEEGLTVIVKDVNAEEDILTKDDLDSVYVDGKLVDPSNYDVETGCVIVTLHKDFLDTLGKGDHTVTINLKDGGKSTAGFSVKAADPTEEGTVPEDGKKPEENTTPEDGKTEPVVPQPETTVPKSDSTGSTSTMMVMGIVLALGCAVTLAASKKRENA